MHLPGNAQPGGGTAGSYLIRHYSKEDGLAGRGGYHLLRDARGFLWVDGFEGVSRFDGHSFTTSGFGLEAGSLLQGHVAQDTNGVLYLYTATGIYRYTGVPGNAFRRIFTPTGGRDIDYVFPVDSNHIYLNGTTDTHLYLLDKGRPRIVTGAAEELLCMAGDSKGFVYLFTTFHKLFSLRDTVVMDSVLPPYTGAQHTQQLHRILQRDHSGRVFLKSLDLLRLDGSRQPMAQPYSAVPADDPFYNYTVSPEPKGMLYRRAGSQWQELTPIRNDLTYNSDLLPAAHNAFWLVSDDGLDYYHPQLYRPCTGNRLLSYYTATPDGRRVMRRDSTIYRNAAIRQFFRDSATYQASHCYLGHDSTIWLCTNAAICYQPQGKGPLKRYVRLPGVDEDFHGVLEDGRGRVWFESLRGITCYDKGTFKHWSVGKSLSDNAFYASATDRNGIYYAVGSLAYAWEDGQPTDITLPLGLTSGLITSLATDKDGGVWACPHLPRLVKVGRSGPGHYFVADSLALEVNGTPFVADAIAFDSSGNLWAAAYGQLVIYLRQPGSRFSTNTKLVISGKSQHLTPLSDFRIRLNASPDGGKMYLSGDSVRVVFDAQEIIKNYPREAPNLQLTEVQLFRRSTDWAAIGQPVSEYGLPVNPLLSSTQNNLSFLYTGITDAEPEGVVYSYRLEGYDEDWQSLTHERVAGYTNLSPGHYTFYVKAADINGVWSAPRAFSFTILPPWYRTWWAIVLWALAAAGIVMWLFQLRLRVVKRRAQMEKLVVEQQLKALRAQINPHFLHNTFDFLSQSLDDYPLAKVREVIDQMSVYLRNVLYRSDQTVATLEEELEFAKDYLAINRLLFHNGFTYSIDVADDVETFAVKVPALLLQPLLENAIKHGARAGGAAPVAIEVMLYNQDGFVICTVSNTAGDKTANTDDSYIAKGLEITSQRLMLLYQGAPVLPSISYALEGAVFRVSIRLPS